MQNQYSKNSCQFNYWNQFNSREINSKYSLFFRDYTGIKYSIVTIVCIGIAITAFLLK